MSDDSAQFDPRFDAAFQRGYTGPPPASSPRRPTTRRVDPPEPIGAPPATPPRESAAVVAPLGAPSSFVTTSSATSSAPDDSAFGDLVEEPARRVNPYLIALAVAGFALIALGAWMLSNLEDMMMQANQGTGNSYLWVQTVMFGSPMIVTLGIAALLGVVAILAARWGR